MGTENSGRKGTFGQKEECGHIEFLCMDSCPRSGAGGWNGCAWLAACVNLRESVACKRLKRAAGGVCYQRSAVAV